MTNRQITSVQAVLRLISACQNREALLIVADHLDEAAADIIAGGGRAADLHELSAACRQQSSQLKESK